MRLADSTKALVLGNVDLIKYCKSCGISQSKISECNIEKMGDNFVFTLRKLGSENIPPTPENDIATQPVPVLILRVSENGNFHFETTSHTVRILNK